MTKKLLAFVLILNINAIASAQLSAEPRDDFIATIYYSCVTPSEKGKEVDARRRRYCNCAATKIADQLDTETVKQIESKQRELDTSVVNAAVGWCRENFAEYSEFPPISKIAKTKDTNNSILFDGKSHRFTAFRQHTYTKEFQLIKTTELENGKYLYDVSIQPDRAKNILSDLRSRKDFALVPLAGSAPRLMEMGFDFTFLIPELSGYLAIDSRRNLLTTQVFNKKDGLFYETHYVRSQALICTALKEERSRIQKSSAISIFREILLVAIRSYAGESYKGGTFIGNTTDGKSLSGTYTIYDNSWLGEHYSRGLDAVFKGTASTSQINAEISRLNCEEF